jgi:hypothetical protein
VNGGDHDSDATAEGAVTLDATIICPHGYSHFYVHSGEDGLADIIDDLSGQKAEPLPLPTGRFHLYCETCKKVFATHRIKSGWTVKSRMDHGHPVELVVIDGDGDEVERRPLAVKERYTVRLPTAP